MPLNEPLACDYMAHFISATTTNNIAEYDGLIRALQLATTMRLTHIQVCGDSNLLMQHMRGLHRIRHVGLRDSYMQARSLASSFYCVFTHRPREANQATDFLSKQAPYFRTDYGSSPNATPLIPRDLATFYDYLDMDLLPNPGLTMPYVLPTIVLPV